MAAALVLAQLKGHMALPQYAHDPSLGLVYITDHYADAAAELLEFLARELPAVKAWSGTVGVGVAANNAEYFDEPALSVMLCDIDASQWRIFSGVAPLPRGDQAPFDVRTALVHTDGATPDLAELVSELAERTSSGYVFGGIAASRGTSVQIAWDRSRVGSGDALDSGLLHGGLSGVAFGPEVQWLSRVTQGCQPIGPWSVVTAVQDNLVLELDGVPALDVLLETLNVSLDGDPQPALRAVRETLVGLQDEGRSEQRSTGHFGAQTRVRHIIGLDGVRRGVALAENVALGTQLAFCQRHVAAARADLMRICAEIREELTPEEDVLPAHGDAFRADEHEALDGHIPGAEKRIVGAVYVSCSGRGGPHFGGPSAELQIVRHALGDVPLVGFFAAGEIAAHRVYGYTGVLTVFMSDVPAH